MYLGKGDRCAVVGMLQTRSYDAKDGTKRYVTEILAEEVEFLGSKMLENARQEDETPTGGQEQQGFTQVEDDELPF